MTEDLYNTLFDELKKAPIINGHLNRFVSFVSIEKLGINPQSIYDTPVGIYSYPLDYVLEKIDPNLNFIDVPFASDAEFFYVFSVKGNILDISNMKNGEYRNYLKNLYIIIKNTLKKYITNVNNWGDYDKNFYFLRNIIMHNDDYVDSGLSKKLLKTTFINNIIEKLNLDKKEIKNIEHLLYILFKNYKHNSENIDYIAKILIFLYENLSFRYSLVKTKLGGRFWYIVLSVARLLTILREENILEIFIKPINYLRTKISIISNLFLKLNIDGVIDYGDGIIHENEPVQAVFFRKNIIYNEKIFDNKYSLKTGEEIMFGDLLGSPKQSRIYFGDNVKKYPGMKFFDLPEDHFPNKKEMHNFFYINKIILGKIFNNLKNIIVKNRDQFIKFVQNKKITENLVKKFIINKLFEILKDDINKKPYYKMIIGFVTENLKSSFIKDQLNRINLNS